MIVHTIIENIPFYTQLCMDRKFAQLIKDLFLQNLDKYHSYEYLK